MNEFEQLEKKLNKISDNLAPSKLQKQRVANVIFSREYGKKESNFYYSSMNVFKSKLFWALGGFFALGMFLIVPIVFMSFGFVRQDARDLVISPYDSQNKSLEAGFAGENESGIMQDEGLSATNQDFEIMDGKHVIAPAPVLLGLENNEQDRYVPPLYQNTKEDIVTTQDERAQLREAYINVGVEDLSVKYIELTSKISALGGYLKSSDVNFSTDYGYANIVVRVPVEVFDEFANFVRGLGEVSSESIQILDKQSELTEVQERISNAQAKIEELEAKNVLTNEEKNELMSMKNSLEFDQNNETQLKKETEFSTVIVYLTSEIDGSSIGSVWKDVADTLLYVLKFWASALMWSLVPLTFIAPVVIVVVLIVKVVKRKKKN